LDYIFVVVKDYEKNNWQKYPLSHFNEFKKTQLNGRYPEIRIYSGF